MKTSVVVTHWAQDAERSATMRDSILSLVNTVPEGTEVIVVDNGGNLADGEFLLGLADRGDLACYVRNRKNMSFGYARNQGIRLSSGDHLVVADNDILYGEGWLEACLEALAMHPERRLLASPFDYPTPVLKDKYAVDTLAVGERTYTLSMRAGSNCTVMRRSDFEAIGWYSQHRIAGTHWTDAAVRLGYLVAVVPTRGCVDAGLRRGYNHTVDIPFRTL